MILIVHIMVSSQVTWYKYLNGWNSCIVYMKNHTTMCE